MSTFHYIPDSAAIEVLKMIDDFREDIVYHEKHDQGTNPNEASRQKHRSRIAVLQGKIIALQAILRRLELTNDIKMSLIAEDLCEKIMAVRKDKMADKYVGIIAYYELQPRYQWREDGNNLVACVSNVKGWPYGQTTGMTDCGDGTFIADHEQAGPGCWVLGGRYVPINVDELREDDETKAMEEARKRVAEREAKKKGGNI